MNKIIIVASGGLDSTAYIGYFHAEAGWEVECMTFDYGQKAQKETQALRDICNELNIPLKVVPLSFMNELWKGNQLTDSSTKIKKEYDPTVVVPLRNGVMLMIAFAYAGTIKANAVGYGSHLGDIGMFHHDGYGTTEYFYPDCSPEFARQLHRAVHKGMFKGEPKPIIDAPAMRGWSKSTLLQEGYKAIGDLIFKTWSCYDNGEKHCGECESCINRQNAFTKANIQDKTEYMEVKQPED